MARKPIKIKKSHEGLMARDVGKKKGQKMTHADLESELHSKNPAKRKRGLFAKNIAGVK